MTDLNQSGDMAAAIKFLIDKTQVSISDLQLEFCQDYSWAAATMEALEKAGHVGTFTGDRFRLVLNPDKA